MLDVIIVGDLDTDQFYLVPRIPTWDEGILVNEWYEFPGGKGGNTAAALSRLGASVGIVAPIGDDRYGGIALNGMLSAGVDTGGVSVIPGGKTYYCIMMLDGTGEKAILVIHTDLTYPDSNLISRNKQYISSAKHLHVIGLEPERMLLAMNIAKQANLTISIDLDAAYQGYDACLPAVEMADIIFLNRHGAERLYPGSAPQAVIEKLSLLGPSIVVLTMGIRGVVAIGPGGVFQANAYHVRTMDTTGAGDVFSAAFIYAYRNRWSIDKALTFSTAAASISTTAIGGQSALPTENDVWDFLSQY